MNFHKRAEGRSTIRSIEILYRDDEAEMRSLPAMGADGIITDCPARLLAITA
jgi:hypothetical protein